jgi:hypothetical protein
MKLAIPDPRPIEVSPQSFQQRVAFPGITRAARELNISRGHLFACLTGERKSRRTIRRWTAWLEKNPAYAALQRQTPPAA